MPDISLTQLIACGVHPTQANLMLTPLQNAIMQWDISTPERIAAFLAQAIHESTGFAQMEENLWYTTPERIRAVFPSEVKSLADARMLAGNPQALANRVYALRNGNGDEASGDGWRYRGRGIFGLTGLDNYKAAEIGTGEVYTQRPDLAARPDHAANIAAWYWESTGCNRFADRGDFNAITKAIAGPPMQGLKERTALLATCAKVLA